MKLLYFNQLRHNKTITSTSFSDIKIKKAQMVFYKIIIINLLYRGEIKAILKLI